MSARERAEALDRDDVLGFTRDEFMIPTKAQIASTNLASSDNDGERCTYLCGNSLGLQPKQTAERISQYLSTWATQGVQGHFKVLSGSPLPTWLDADEHVAKLMAPLVGAHASEINVMQTLTSNLHLVLSAFYKPNALGRHKILMERRAFPSDHFAAESQIRHHGLSPATSLVELEAPYSEDGVLTTYDVQALISAHAADTAVLLLPGVQYYTGQLLDMAVITAYAHTHDVVVIWDLAHAVGNVPLALHDWDVDAAVWCSYKYLNGGPGCIGGMFVHERHTRVRPHAEGRAYMDRLAGWWGNDKATRFDMDTGFHPVPGAAGFQLSNPSILDMTSLGTSLEVFERAGGMTALRTKSVQLTAFLETLLGEMDETDKAMFRIITPPNPKDRGAQLSLRLADGLLDVVMKELESRAVIVDERKPNVIRVAPAPLYNTFQDCVRFFEGFAAALVVARDAGMLPASA